MERVATSRYRIMVRTSGFHPLNRGSIPRSATKKKVFQFWNAFFFWSLWETRTLTFRGRFRPTIRILPKGVFKIGKCSYAAP